jgi:hypothetical protein
MDGKYGQLHIVIQPSFTGLLEEFLNGQVTTSHGEVAHFTPYKSHLLRASQHASLHISPEIHDEHQRAFLILVLLYSETTYKDVRCSTSECTIIWRPALTDIIRHRVLRQLNFRSRARA